MFCCALLYVHSSIAIILMGKRELIALLNLSSWCLVMVERLFLAVPRGCLQFVIVVFPDHTHLLTVSPWASMWSVTVVFPNHTNLHVYLRVYVFMLQMFKNTISVALCTYTCNKIHDTCIYTQMLHQICKNSDKDLTRVCLITW